MSKTNQSNLIGTMNGKEINIKEYYELIKKRLWIVLTITILTTAAGYLFSHQNSNPLYQTSTRIIIGSDSEYMKTLMVMIKDPIIMEKVKGELELTQSTDAVAGQIAVSRIDESQVIRISVTDGNPAMAANIANTTARVFKSEIVNILNFNDVQLLSEAKENPIPINESGNRMVIIGFIFGIITSIGLIFLLDTLDGTVKKESEVEEMLGVPVLGVISNMNKKKLVARKANQADLELRGGTVDIK